MIPHSGNGLDPNIFSSQPVGTCTGCKATDGVLDGVVSYLSPSTCLWAARCRTSCCLSPSSQRTVPARSGGNARRGSEYMVCPRAADELACQSAAGSYRGVLRSTQISGPWLRCGHLAAQGLGWTSSMSTSFRRDRHDELMTTVKNTTSVRTTPTTMRIIWKLVTPGVLDGWVEARVLVSMLETVATRDSDVTELTPEGQPIDGLMVDRTCVG